MAADTSSAAPHTPARSGPRLVPPIARHGPDDGDNEEDGDGDGGRDDDSDDDNDSDVDSDADGDEPKLKYSRLTGALGPVYRNGDATSAFVVAGDKMVGCPTTLLPAMNMRQTHDGDNDDDDYDAD